MNTISEDKTQKIAMFTGDLNALAYVKPMMTDRGTCYAVCSSEGVQLAVFGTRDAAFYAAIQHDLEPTMIH
jgi:hypothetical protein